MSNVLTAPEVTFELEGVQYQGSYHQNPGGDLGGFVADTATAVGGTIEPGAAVLDNAIVRSSRIEAGSIVRGRARVEQSIVRRHATVSEYATVQNSTLEGDLTVSGHAVVRSSEISGDITYSPFTYREASSTVAGDVVIDDSFYYGRLYFLEAEDLAQTTTVEQKNFLRRLFAPFRRDRYNRLEGANIGHAFIEARGFLAPVAFKDVA